MKNLLILSIAGAVAASGFLIPHGASAPPARTDLLATVTIDGVPLALRVGDGCNEVKASTDGDHLRVSVCTDAEETLAIDLETSRRTSPHDVASHSVRVRAARTDGQVVPIAKLPGLEATLKTN